MSHDVYFTTISLPRGRGSFKVVDVWCTGGLQLPVGTLEEMRRLGLADCGGPAVRRSLGCRRIGVLARGDSAMRDVKNGGPNDDRLPDKRFAAERQQSSRTWWHLMHCCSQTNGVALVQSAASGGPRDDHERVLLLLFQGSANDVFCRIQMTLSHSGGDTIPPS